MDKEITPKENPELKEAVLHIEELSKTDVLRGGLSGLVDIGTAIFKDGRGALADSFNIIAQRAIRGQYTGTTYEIIQNLLEKGKVSKETLETEAFKVGLLKTMQQSNKPTFNVEQFKITQEIFLGASIEGKRSLEDNSTGFLMKTCGDLSEPAIHVFRAAVSLQRKLADPEYVEKNNIECSGGTVAFGIWQTIVMNDSGLKYGAAFNPAEAELIASELIEKADYTVESRSGTGRRVSDMGVDAALLIETYEQASKD